MYQAVSEGEVDVICAFATDGRIAAYNLKPLKDDRKFFPPYEAAPVIRREFIEAYPEIQNILSLLAGAINDEMMQRLNLMVDKEKQTPAEVAETFLKTRGLR
jgi:glycine betaine/choline ABC-type transport system substrate-binding protein